MKNGMKCVSFNSLSELPTAAAALSRSFGAPDDLELIAKLQAQTRHGGHLEIGAGHARDRDAEAIVEIEFADGFAEHIAIGYDHAAKGDVALGEEEVFIAAPADDALELLEPRARADDREAIVEMNHGRVSGGHCFIAVANAGNGDARFDPAGNRVEPHAVEIRIRYDERAAFQWIDLARGSSPRMPRPRARDRCGRFV